jgi:hypothetical protein
MEPAMKPMTPDEISTAAGNHKIMRIPEPVIVAVNELLIENWHEAVRTARVLQDDIIEKIQEISDLDRDTIFSEGYLDIEPLFAEYGWEVTYNKPAFNGSYKAYFIFKKKDEKS